MPYQEVAAARTDRSRTYQDDANPRKHVWTGGLARIAYDAGEEHLRPINMTPERVVNAQFDGWRIDDAPWRYMLGRPDGEADGWIVAGFRGGGGNWHNFGFRALGALYYEHTTGNTQRIGGEPDYDRANLTHTPQTVTIGPNDDEIPVAARAEWADVWPGVDLQFRIDGYRLKEDIVVSQATREAIPPPSDFGMIAANTWFAVLFRIDWSDVPKVVRDNVEIDRDGVFLDDGAPIELRNAADALLAFMPISDVYVETGDGERERVPLTKRFYRDTDGQHYLIMGAPALDIAALPAGDLHFDPTVDIDISASADTAHETSNGSVYLDEAATIIVDATNEFFGRRFPGVTIPDGSTIDSSYVSVYVDSPYDDPDHTVYAEDGGTPAQFVESSNNISDRTPTTASVNWASTDLGTDGYYNTPALDTIIEELLASYSYASGAAMVFIIQGGSDSGRDLGIKGLAAGNPANLTIEYTAGGGGPTGLTAGDLTLSAPVLDTPSLSQVHILMTGDLTSAAPALDTPALSQVHTLSVGDLALSEPALDTPTLSVFEHLTTGDLLLAAPVLDMPSLSQVHALTAGDLALAAPVLDTPSMAQVHILSVGDLAVSAPVLDTPALSQVHILSTSDLLLTAPALDTPALAQVHILSVGDLLLAAPTLDTPALSQVHILAVGDLLLAAPVLDTPSIGAQTDHLVAGDLLLSAPVLDTPALAQVHILSTGDLSLTAPALDNPALAQVHILAVGDLLLAAAVLDTPALAQIHILSTGDLLLTAPALDTPTLGQAQALPVGDLLLTAPALDSPTLSQVHILSVGDLLLAAPVLDTPYLNRELAAGLVTVFITGKAPAVAFTATQPDIGFTSRQPSIKLAA